MSRCLRIVVVLAVCSCGAANVFAQAPAEKPKTRVELRWVEMKPVEGLTEAEGFQTSCDPDDIAYPHKKPALVLTAAEVTEAELTEQDFRKNGLGLYYMVRLHLTKEAREKLAASCEGKKMRLLTVVVDDKCWGIRRYEKDEEKKLVPEQARAATFSPDVGFFSSRLEAQRLVRVFK